MVAILNEEGMKQSELMGEAPNRNYALYVFFREIKTRDKSLEGKKLVGDDARKVRTLLDSLANRTGGQHDLEALDVSSYFHDWVTVLLDKPFNPPRKKAQYLAENFAKHMKTRARKKGKYVVIIVTPLRLIVCNSYTGQMALSVDLEVIETMLSEDNIDKFAEFIEKEQRIVVNHFDKYDTQSFTDWLGIPESEVIYEQKGAVKLQTTIEGFTCIFELTREEIVEKIFWSDNYKIEDGHLKTPSRKYPLISIKWGRTPYALLRRL